jgi:hypothetical protein
MMVKISGIPIVGATDLDMKTQRTLGKQEKKNVGNGPILIDYRPINMVRGE